MSFLGMGLMEILFILVVALIIWGPGKLPEIARTLGKTTRALKKASSDLTTQITKELEVEEKDHSSQSKANNDDKTQKLDAGKTTSSKTGTTSPKD